MSSSRELLQKYWGWPDFRPGQKEAIEASLSGKNTLVVLPTGGGKSLCFQLTALLQDGICIVVSPLVALMIDQVSALKSKNIRAMSIHGSMSENELVEALDQCAFGNIKLLYLSPERLRNPIVCERLKTLPISLLAIDEAHCISQWGHDFRPAYRQIAQFHNILNKPAVMALTATATQKVKADIIASLQLEDTQLIQTSFFRPNLSYQVIHTENKLGVIQSMLKNSSGNTILYLRTRRHCEMLVEQLRMEGIHARYFHGGSSNKTELIEDWQSGRVPIMVATSAFGMGIDQANVRQVIHAALPESIESYYQEAGRAGRDEQPAKASIVTSARDMHVVSNQFMDSFPRADLVRQVYAKLCAYFQIAYGEIPLEPLDMSFESFIETYNFPSKKTYEVFRLLDRIGCIRWSNLVVERFRIQVLYKGKELRNLIRKDSPLSTILNIFVRLYPNITETAQSVDGSQLSKRTGIGLDQLKVHFRALEKNGYAAISSWNCDTRLFFLEPREDEHILNRAIKHLDHILETRKVQLKAVQDYVENDKQCKQALLLDYFGETNKTTCEHCSTCQSTQNPRQLQSAIMAILQKQPSSAKNLSKLLVIEEKTIIVSLMEMLNEERIFQKDHQFYINE